MNIKVDIAVIGGGPAGLAAACSAKDSGAKSVLILERDKEAGGILNQCIHNGFGLHHFKEELTGPEYAERFIVQAKEKQVDIMLNTMVLSIENKKVYAVNKDIGIVEIEAGAIILAMGCRERTRGAISIPGDRGSGIYSAGTAQRYINMDGFMVGKRVVILGSGDIGLIMARRMTLEGAKVLACVEICPYSNGLTRNIVQCLDDYDIPLYLSHTITNVIGKQRLEQVVISKVDENRQIIPGTEQVFDCDTLLLSVGLIPENEITKDANISLDNRTKGAIVYENMETDSEGVFSCGNVLHVHDLVDFVTAESIKAGKAAVEYINGNKLENSDYVEVTNGNAITYTVPQRIRKSALESNVQLFFRVNNQYESGTIEIREGENIICKYKKTHLAPGEMEQVSIPQKILSSVTAEKLTVSLNVSEG